MSFQTFKENFEATLRLFGSFPSSRLKNLAGGNFLFASGIPFAGENWAWIKTSPTPGPSLPMNGEGGECCPCSPSPFMERGLGGEVLYLREFFGSLPFVVPIFSTLSPELEKKFDDIGLRVRGRFDAMILDLKKLPSSASLTPPSGRGAGAVNVVDAKPPSQRGDARRAGGSLWASTCWSGFDGGDDVPEQFLTFAHHAVACEKIKLFLEFADEKPCGTAMLAEGADAFGLFYVSVVPEMRKSGVGTRIMREVINFARGRKRYMTLLATPMGVPLYKKMGFEPVAQIPIRSFSEDIL